MNISKIQPLFVGRKSLNVMNTLCHGKNMTLQPKNEKQRRYIDMLNADKPYIVVASGSAGTGKTLLATHIGVKKLLQDEYRKIIITRPAVSVDEAIGFLPGTLEKKMEPWTRPVFDVLSMHFPRNKIESMMKEQIIEICPLAFLRGRSFDNCWIICDESQNTTVNQMLMVLTRIGKGSKIVITGDPNQYDRGFTNNGLSDLLQRLEYTQEETLDLATIDDADSSNNIGIVEFAETDVERHPVIPYVLDLYKTI